jgi:hypothetical protein
MAVKQNLCERAAFILNVPNLPFRNAKMAEALGMTVDDFADIVPSFAACNLVFAMLTESQSGLIAADLVDERRAALISETGRLNHGAINRALLKARSLCVFSAMVLGGGRAVLPLIVFKVATDKVVQVREAWESLDLPAWGVFAAFCVVAAALFLNDIPKSATAIPDLVEEDDEGETDGIALGPISS